MRVLDLSVVIDASLGDDEATGSIADRPIANAKLPHRLLMWPPAPTIARPEDQADAGLRVLHDATDAITPPRR
jgi:hypothetical protein